MKRPVKKILNELSFATGRYLSPPDFLSLVVTFKCNFSCLTCAIWQKDDLKELGNDDWLSISADLKKVFPTRTFVEVNGGEPLLRKELVWGLVPELKRHFKTVALNTNGSTITAEVIGQLESAGLDIIKISLYSLDPQIHNQLRGSELAFEKAKAALELILKKQDQARGRSADHFKKYQNPARAFKLFEQARRRYYLQPLDEAVEGRGTKDSARTDLPADLWPDQISVNEFFSWLALSQIKLKNSPAGLEAIKNYYLNPESALKFRCFAGQRSAVIIRRRGSLFVEAPADRLY